MGGATGFVVCVAAGFGSAERVATGTDGLGSAEGEAEGVGDDDGEGVSEGRADVCDGTADAEEATGGRDTAGPSPSAGPHATETPATSNPTSTRWTSPLVRLPFRSSLPLTLRTRTPTRSVRRRHIV
ncbi:hypothetical protein [Streptomyces sp. NPDC041003]|uniref:hypothetical protein n=1 Tax=Streptomyces sp. NPDC041003 TaxID=3155730 RepID=UPI003402C6D0